MRLHGIKVAHKKRTADCAPERLPIPQYVTIPMSMHIGKPAQMTIHKGEDVKVGQLIGEADGFVPYNGEAYEVKATFVDGEETKDLDVRIKENCPVTLAYAYVKNHDIDNAKRIISKAKKKQGDNVPSELLELEKELDKKNN